MTGAEALLRTLTACGVDLCLANPGTSEMHLIAALDTVPAMRGVLALHEGVATGAADGFARMSGRPAVTLLHLGPGLGNGLANLHNARRAQVPVVALVGDHATDHKRYDPQLESDIETVARNVSLWIGRATGAAGLGADAAAAVQAAAGPPAGVATLIVPADAAWSDGGVAAGPLPARPREAAAADAVEAAARVLRSGEPAALLLGGGALRRRGLTAAARVAAASGSRLLCETFPARLERGAGLPPVERLAYLAEFAAAQLDGLGHLVVAGATAPVCFFAYPDRPSTPLPDGCRVHVLAGAGDDAAASLESLAAALGGDGTPALQAPSRPRPPEGALTAEAVAMAVGALLPEGAVVSDEANTSGLFLPGHTAGAPPHEVLTLTGGAIGQGLPVATGAALACPGRRVLALEADGSAMYTLQSLWTMAREGLDVTTVVFSNRAYAILRMERARVGAAAGGTRADPMLALDRPDLDFVALARGMGVPASRATTAEEFTGQLARSLSEPGPGLIEAVVPSMF